MIATTNTRNVKKMLQRIQDFRKLLDLYSAHSNVKGELGTVALVCDQNCSNFVG